MRERGQKLKYIFLGSRQWKERGCERREKPDPRDVKEQRICRSNPTMGEFGDYFSVVPSVSGVFPEQTMQLL